MRDASFASFIAEFREATQRVAVAPERIERWRGRLPDQLLSYWQSEGWCAYADGLFWTVDPDVYEATADAWLAQTFLPRLDRFHVIARTAFGELYACGEHVGPRLTLLCPANALIAFPQDMHAKSGDQLDADVRAFFAVRRKACCDLKDDFNVPLFARAVGRLGPLAADELYGFVPALNEGGTMELESLVKAKIAPHLSALLRLAAPALPFPETALAAAPGTPARGNGW